MVKDSKNKCKAWAIVVKARDAVRSTDSVSSFRSPGSVGKLDNTISSRTVVVYVVRFRQCSEPPTDPLLSHLRKLRLVFELITKQHRKTIYLVFVLCVLRFRLASHFNAKTFTRSTRRCLRMDNTLAAFTFTRKRRVEHNTAEWSPPENRQRPFRRPTCEEQNTLPPHRPAPSYFQRKSGRCGKSRF
jgi:hypothetical protein